MTTRETQAAWLEAIAMEMRTNADWADEFQYLNAVDCMWDQDDAATLMCEVIDGHPIRRKPNSIECWAVVNDLGEPVVFRESLYSATQEENCIIGATRVARLVEQED